MEQITYLMLIFSKVLFWLINVGMANLYKSLKKPHDVEFYQKKAAQIIKSNNWIYLYIIRRSFDNYEVINHIIFRTRICGFLGAISHPTSVYDVFKYVGSFGKN